MNNFDVRLKKGEIYEYKILKLLRVNGIKCFARRLYYEINDKKEFVGDGGIDLTGNYNEVFFAIQAKYRKGHHNEQAEDIEKFDKALEMQPREVVGFFITTIDFSIESKEAALNSKRKIILCNTNNIVSKIKSLSLIKDKQLLKPSVSYLKQLNEVKNILETDEDKIEIRTKNKNIYLMLVENRIDKWENNGWCGQNNQELKSPRKLCNEINDLLKKKTNVTFYYIKNQD
jgi:Restriction endonuclease